MHKLIQKMEDQLEVEIKNATEKLTTGNLTNIVLLTIGMKNLECMEKGEWESAAKMAEIAEDVISKYSNGRYDHNVDALYDSYIAAKKAYRDNGDQGHKDKLMECVGRLMVEIYDLLSSMLLDSDFQDERKAINQRIRMLAEM